MAPVRTLNPQHNALQLSTSFVLLQGLAEGEDGLPLPAGLGSNTVIRYTEVFINRGGVSFMTVTSLMRIQSVCVLRDATKVMTGLFVNNKQPVKEQQNSAETIGTCSPL